MVAFVLGNGTGRLYLIQNGGNLLRECLETFSPLRLACDECVESPPFAFQLPKS